MVNTKIMLKKGCSKDLISMNHVCNMDNCDCYLMTDYNGSRSSVRLSDNAYYACHCFPIKEGCFYFSGTQFCVDPHLLSC